MEREIKQQQTMTSTQKNTQDTQLTSASGYDVSRMRFSEPIEGNVPTAAPAAGEKPKPAIKFKRINISTMNDDGTEGELILPTPKVFSFGVSDNNDMATNELNGYTMSLVLHDKDGATEEQVEWVDTFNNIVDHAAKHVVKVKGKIGKFQLELNDLMKNKFNPLYVKKEVYTDEEGNENERPIPGAAPTLYAKLIVSKKKGIKIVTKFYKTDGTEVDGAELKGIYCNVNAAIKIESVFVGKNISMQIKLYEAVVEPLQSGMKRLLTVRPPTDSKVLTYKPSAKNPLPMADGDSDGEGSLKSDDEEEAPKPVVPTKPRVLKKAGAAAPRKKVVAASE